MKFRSGFVSNSSSSSFVIAGIKIPNTALSHEKLDELYDDGNLIITGSEDGVPKGFTVIGKALADVHSDESYLDYGAFSLDQIVQLIADVETKTGLTGERGVFTGTRLC
jgi:hypothetical protein